MGDWSNRVKADKPAPTVQTHGRPKTRSEMTLPVGKGVGTNRSYRPVLQSFDTVSPTITTGSLIEGGSGWLAGAFGVPPTLPPSPLDFTQDPPTGLTVISTFSGCGGSSLGYRLAGFNVRAALEFDKEAAETYRANFATPLLEQDIRLTSGADLLAAAGLAVGELDVLDGSPPCAAFSTAGKREKSWNQVREYSGQKQRIDDLFDEYVRLVREIRPRVFVAENVSGLVKGVAKGEFKRILRLMRDAGYRVESRLLDAKWLGVPQSRQRLIFVGVRTDLDRAPTFPAPFGPLITIRDVLPWISGVGTFAGDYDKQRDRSWSDAARPAPAVLQSAQRPPLIESAPGYGNDRVTGRTGPHFERVECEPDQPMNSVLVSDPDQTRYEVEYVETDISRYAIGAEWDKLKPGESTFYGGRLHRPDPDRPCPTVTQRGGSVNAASVTHPTERRKFTIAELKRICAFPDDFILTGSYAEQWERLGRAVPPLMMRAIARAIRDGVFTSIDAALQGAD